MIYLQPREPNGAVNISESFTASFGGGAYRLSWRVLRSRPRFVLRKTAARVRLRFFGFPGTGSIRPGPDGSFTTKPGRFQDGAYFIFSHMTVRYCWTTPISRWRGTVVDDECSRTRSHRHRVIKPCTGHAGSYSGPDLRTRLQHYNGYNRSQATGKSTLIFYGLYTYGLTVIFYHKTS